MKRAANEILRRSDHGDWPLPYFCECDDPGCLRAVWLDDREYDRLRMRGAIRIETARVAA